MTKKQLKKKLRSNKLGRYRMARLREVGAQEAYVEAVLNQSAANNPNNYDREIHLMRRYDPRGLMSDVLYVSFVFEESPQGYSYWKDIIVKLDSSEGKNEVAEENA